MSDPRVRGFVKDVLEYGSDAFLEATLNAGSLEQHLRMKGMIEMFINEKAFSEKINAVLNTAAKCRAIEDSASSHQ